jgi:hypothetical protein
MNTPDAMRALTSGTTASVSAPMTDHGTVIVTRRHGDSCPFTVTNDFGEMKRTYKFRRIASAFQRAREHTNTNVEWSTAA